MKTKDRFLDFIIYGIIASIIIFFAVGCEKQSDGSGNILVHVQHDGKALDQPSIFIKYNSPASPSNFDYQQGGDAIGEAYFKNLKPGTYYIFGRGYDPVTKTYVNGTAQTEIISRSRMNENKVSVDTQ